LSCVNSFSVCSSLFLSKPKDRLNEVRPFYYLFLFFFFTDEITSGQKVDLVAKSLLTAAGIDPTKIIEAVDQTGEAYLQETLDTFQTITPEGIMPIDEDEARGEVVKALRMLSIATRLETIASKLKKEGYERVSRVLAGTRLPGFFTLMDDCFGPPDQPETGEEEPPSDSEDFAQGEHADTPSTSRPTTREPSPDLSSPPPKKSKMGRGVKKTIALTPYLLQTGEDPTNAGVPPEMINPVSRITKRGRLTAVYKCKLQDTSDNTKGCGYLSENRASYLSHLRKDHLHIGLKCPNCSFTTGQSGSYKTHVSKTCPALAPQPGALILEPADIEGAQAAEAVVAALSK
jgi:uncharacterized C2H2 Zn-finger protein